VNKSKPGCRTRELIEVVRVGIEQKNNGRWVLWSHCRGQAKITRIFPGYDYRWREEAVKALSDWLCGP
jgi:hypothetical protein